MRVRAPQSRRQAFTLAEVLVALGLISLASLAFLVYLRYASISLTDITNETVYGQQAGQTSSFLLQRIRASHAFTVSADGRTLTLEFDDDPDTDTNNDGDKYNDTNHVEIFQFSDGDGSVSTLADNVLTYKATSTATAIVLARRVNLIGSTPVFSATSSKVVGISFSVSGGAIRSKSQRVNIVTTGYRLN